MTTLDSLMSQKNEIKHDMRSLNPETSLYKRLKVQLDEIALRIHHHKHPHDPAQSIPTPLSGSVLDTRRGDLLRF